MSYLGHARDLLAVGLEDGSPEYRKAVRYVSKTVGYVTKALASSRAGIPQHLRHLQREVVGQLLDAGKVPPSRAYFGEPTKTVTFSQSWPIRPGQVMQQERLLVEPQVKRQLGRRVTTDEVRNSPAAVRSDSSRLASKIPVGSNELSRFPEPASRPVFEPASSSPVTVGDLTLTDEQSAFYEAVTTADSGVFALAALAGTGKTSLQRLLVEHFAPQPVLFTTHQKSTVRDFVRDVPGATGVNIDKLAFRAVCDFLDERRDDAEYQAQYERFLDAVWGDGKDDEGIPDWLCMDSHEFLQLGIHASPGQVLDVLRELIKVKDMDLPGFSMSGEELLVSAYHAYKRALVDGSCEVLREHATTTCRDRSLPWLEDIVEAIQSVGQDILSLLLSFDVPQLWDFEAIRYVWVTVLDSVLPLNPSLIILDEAQDLAAVLSRSVLTWAKSCPVVVSGDPFQDIFAFAGGQAEVFASQARRFALTKSFRFGPEVAALAQKYLPAGAPVLSGVGGAVSDGSTVVLTHTGRAARKVTAEILASGGRVAWPKYSDEVVKLSRGLKDWPPEALQDLEDAFNGSSSDYTLEELEAFALFSDPLLSRLSTTQETRMFVSTVHASKGKEFDHVLLHRGVLDSAVSDKERYVAFTRARQNVGQYITKSS